MDPVVHVTCESHCALHHPLVHNTRYYMIFNGLTSTNIGPARTKIESVVLARGVVAGVFARACRREVR